MRYWVAVVSGAISFSRLRTGEQNWFCLNVGCAPGDPVLLYATKKASNGGGLYGVFQVTKVDDEKRALCSPYNAFGFGPQLCYVELEKLSEFKKLIPMSDVKKISKFRESAAVRRTFQGTCFEVLESQFSAAVEYCNNA